jgi:hypothetical protein
MSNAQAAAMRRPSAIRPEGSAPPGKTKKATSMNSDNEDEMSEGQKRFIAFAKRKAAMDSQSGSTHPIKTRREEREAGGARVTTGSAQKDTRAANSRHSKTWVVIFSSAEVSCRLPSQQQWTSVTLIPCHSQGIACCFASFGTSTGTQFGWSRRYCVKSE